MLYQPTCQGYLLAVVSCPPSNLPDLPVVVVPQEQLEPVAGETLSVASPLDEEKKGERA